MFLEGKVIAITGAGRGIGRAVALECARHGASVIVNDYGVSMSGEDPTSEVADAVVAEIIAAGGKAIAVPGDMLDSEYLKVLVKKAAEFGNGKIHIIVNNAGSALSPTIVALY